MCFLFLFFCYAAYCNRNQVFVLRFECMRWTSGMWFYFFASQKHSLPHVLLFVAFLWQELVAALVLPDEIKAVVVGHHHHCIGNRQQRQVNSYFFFIVVGWFDVMLAGLAASCTVPYINCQFAWLPHSFSPSLSHMSVCNAAKLQVVFEYSFELWFWFWFSAKEERKRY